MAHRLRSASLTGYADLARAAGVDPFPLLAAAGVPPAALSDPDLPIAADAFGRVLEATAAAAGWDDFGLRLAERRDLANLGPLGLMLRDQPTVGDALAALARYVPLQNERLRVVVAIEGDLAVVRMAVAGRGRMLRQAAELSVAVACGALNALLGAAWRPAFVAFRHRPPADAARHRRVFGCPVAFDHEFDGFAVPAAHLEDRVPHAEPQMARHVRHYLDDLLQRRDAAAGDQVRDLIATLLPGGLCSLERVARHLSVDPRTLQRRLAREGLTFAAVVDGLRQDLARRDLELGGRSLSEIAERLGFSALSAFSRWFRGRFGVSPRAWRDRIRAT